MLNNYETLNWIESNGGPLLLLPHDLWPLWSGTRPLDLSETDADWEYDVDSNCDYNRACKIDDYLGVVQVGEEEGLVLSEPLPTAWLSTENVLVRWLYADSDSAVISALSDISNAPWQSTGINFKINSSPLYLFDSAYLGDEIHNQNSKPLEIELLPGKYSLVTAEYKPNENTSLILHRFIRK